MSSSATGVGMPICFLGAILLILTQKSSQKFGDVLGIMVEHSWADLVDMGPADASICSALRFISKLCF